MVLKDKRKLLIEARNLFLNSEDQALLKDISFSWLEGEAWAVTGPSGSGKTLLGKLLAGRLSPSSGELAFHLPSTAARLMISQQHDFRENSTRSYYQQRFDSNYGQDSPTVEDTLKKVWKPMIASLGWEEEFGRIAGLLQISHLRYSRLIELSNGEGKRIQLASALLQYPNLIVLDHPFFGLDPEARKTLHGIINSLIHSGVVIFLITSPGELPTQITHIIELQEGSIAGIYTRELFLLEYKPAVKTKEKLSLPFQDIYPEEDNDFEVAVEMKNVNVRYGDKTILQNINWKVMKGERWSLSGPNGSGKSTLLSLITGDNPQAYGNELWLFDKRKGSGESIWDIKKKIGYISPELHIYFQRDLSFTENLSAHGNNNTLSGYGQPGTTAFKAIASGFNDQIGSSREITSWQIRQVNAWLEILCIPELKHQPLYKISLGYQRIVLLGRALVKNPPLLILDEPCQGLDKEQTERFVQIVDLVCNHFNKTLIYVTHYREDLPASVNKFLMLKDGKVESIVN